MPNSSLRSPVSTFIESTFTSVWALELLLFLKQEPERSWDRGELVRGLRASDSVVERALEGLLTAGLILLEGDGTARFAPANDEVRGLVDGVEQLYARRPDAVRRMIILSRSDSLSAFADAFRLRKD